MWRKALSHYGLVSVNGQTLSRHLHWRLRLSPCQPTEMYGTKVNPLNYIAIDGAFEPGLEVVLVDKIQSVGDRNVINQVRICKFRVKGGHFSG
jgi:hypothetical protein